MKNNLLILILALMICICTGCGSSKYSYQGDKKDLFTDKEIELCEKALGVIDSFLSLDIDSDDAKDKLSIILAQIYDKDDDSSRTYWIGYEINSVKEHLDDDIFLDSVTRERDSISERIEIQKNGYQDLSDDNIKKLDDVFDILYRCKDGKLNQKDTVSELSKIEIKNTDMTSDHLSSEVHYIITEISGQHYNDDFEEEYYSYEGDELRDKANSMIFYLSCSWIKDYKPQKNNL